MQKLDLVIQGQIFDYTQKIVDSYKTLEWVNDVIVSTWEDDPPILADKVVRSLPITNLGIGNRNAQIVTSHRGLQEVKTDFCAKLRSDQTISLDSMNKMYGFSLKNQEKICVAGFYRPFPFHPRDHIFWGQTAEVAEVFDIPLDKQEKVPISELWPQKGSYAQYTRAECYLVSQYLAKKYSRVKAMTENPQNFLVDFSPQWETARELSEELMDKHFIPFPKIDFQWPKHNITSYDYEGCAAFYGEFWSDG